MREEEKKSVTKLKVKRLMRKKWLYPALYLSVAALVLVGVFWYQQGANDLEKLAEQPDSNVKDEVITQDSDQESVPVMDQQESLQMPVADEAAATIVTKFYDYDASEAEQESALVQYQNRYYQSKGIDITREDGEAFDVVASLSGTVTEVKEDPLYGNVVELSHENGVSTVYASLADVQVKAGAEVAQGDVLGTAGSNSFGQASGVHVHFEVLSDGEAVNPEKFFEQPLSKIADAKKAEETATDESAEESELPTQEEIDQPSADTEDPTGSESEEQAPSEEPGGTEGEEQAPSEDPEASEGEEQAPAEGSDEEEQLPNEDSASSISTTQA